VADAGVDDELLGEVHHPPKIKAKGMSEPLVLLGFAFAVLAGLCFTSSNVMVKFIPQVNSWQLLFVRCLMQIVSMVPVMYYYRAHPLGPPDFATRWRIQAQGILGGLLLLCLFKAVSSLPLGDATAIFFSSPAFTMVLSTIILKDHCGLFRTLIASVLLGGVVILSRPPALFPPPQEFPRNATVTRDDDDDDDDRHNPYKGRYEWVGITSAVAVPILSAVLVIITRQARHVHYSVLVFWFAMGGLIVSIVGNYAFDDGSHGLFENWTSEEWTLTILIAVVGIVGSMLMTKAVFWVTPSKVMVVRSFEVVAAYILQVTVFDTPTYLSDLGGTFMVLLAVLGIGVEDRVMALVKWRWI